MLKITFLYAILLSLFFSSSAEEKLPEWQDPDIIQVNRLAPRASFFSYGNYQYALENNRQKSKYYLDLNGNWKFYWTAKPANRPTGFYKIDYDVSSWDVLEVPSSQELEGYGIPVYVKNQTEWTQDLMPPSVPLDYNPVGSYKKEFFLPESWEERKVFIHLGAVRSAFYIWINDQMAGYSQGSKTPAEFDITPFIKTGTNTISIEVYSYSDGSWLECQDFWRLSGIERDIYLFSTPVAHIFDFYADAGLTNNYMDGHLKIKTLIKNGEKKSSRFELKISVFYEGKVIEEKSRKFRIKGNSGQWILLEEKFPGVFSWSAETPELYTLVLELKDRQGKSLEFVSSRIGFRNVEIRNGKFLVNGVPVLIKGVNRYEHDEYTGHVLSRESMLQDIRLIKQNNINTVRTPDYPADPYWYDLCDKYGLYVIDEPNIRTCSDLDDSAFLFALLDRTERMAERDKNHPCIILWSAGDQRSNKIYSDSVNQWIRSRDFNRPVISEFQGMENSDIYCPRFPRIPDILSYAIEIREKPMIMCEYASAMGNSTGNLEDFWEVIKTHDQLQGGCISNWMDQGLTVSTPRGEKYWSYGGDFSQDTLPGAGTSSISGLLFPDRSVHPGLAEVKHVYQPIQFEPVDFSFDEIRISNEYSFRNLENIAIYWEIESQGEVLQQGTLLDPDIPAGKSQIYSLGIKPFKPEPGKEYFLNFTAFQIASDELINSGHIYAFDQFAIPVPHYSYSNGDDGAKVVFESKERLNIDAGGVIYSFDRESGFLSSAKRGETEYLSAPMQLNFWRAPVENDWGNKMPERLGIWKIAGENAELKSMVHEQNKDGYYEINAEYLLPVLESELFIDYLINGRGEVKINVHLLPGRQKNPELPRFGVTISLNGRYNNLEWYGRGPHENYMDRKSSAIVGHYSSTVSDQYVPYIAPQENGYKTDTRWLTLTDNDGGGIMITGTSVFNFSALHYTSKDLTRKQRNGMHTIDLTPSKKVFLNIDESQMGVGGDNSWGAKPYSQYMLPYEKRNYSFILKTIEPGMDFWELYNLNF